MPDAVFTIDYDELANSPQESFTNGNIQITRLLSCAWIYRIQFMKELLGYLAEDSTVYYADEYDTGTIQIPNVFCTTVDIEPLGIDQDTGEYLKAKIIAKYEYRKYNIPSAGNIVYVTESLENASEFLTLPDKLLYWVNDQTRPLNPSETPSKIIPLLQWSYTKNLLTSVPNETLSLPGKVNDASVYSRALDLTFPTETLLCSNPSLTREVTNQGTTAWTVTFRFTYRNNGTASVPLGWNHFPDTRTAGEDITFGRIYDGSGNTRYVYERADFSGFVD